MYIGLFSHVCSHGQIHGITDIGGRCDLGDIHDITDIHPPSTNIALCANGANYPYNSPMYIGLFSHMGSQG